jgi:hypothetical protein
MNLTRALDVALPDIPARTIAERYPRLDPGTTFREHIEDGEPIVRVYIPSSGFMFKLLPAQWSLAQLFDGNRSYSKVAELYSQRMAEFYDEQSVSEFASELKSAGFWYQTPQEKNVLLLLQSKEERRKNLKAKNRFPIFRSLFFPHSIRIGFLLGSTPGHDSFTRDGLLFFPSWASCLQRASASVTGPRLGATPLSSTISRKKPSATSLCFTCWVSSSSPFMNSPMRTPANTAAAVYPPWGLRSSS